MLLALPVLFAAAVGLAFGSFGNVLLVRFAEGESIAGRSRCPRCRRTIASYDLIPLLSFLLLGGKCRACKHGISFQYPLVELASALLFAWAFFLFPDRIWIAASLCLLFWGLLLMTVYDAYYQLIPDLFTAFIFIGATAYALLTWQMVPGAFGSVIALSWFGTQWVVSRGRLVGSGDILLGASLGFWLGIRGTIVMLFLSYIFGALYAVYLLTSGKAKRGSYLAFGPFLALGSVCAFLGFGDFYFSLLFPY